jgi:nucleotidyltransferase/DNA polymerase involved in DNA repair
MPWSEGVVLDASPEARAMGVRRGMPLGSAHRLAPEAAFVDADVEADAAAAAAALDRLSSFSPGVAGTTDPTDPTFGSVEVQLDGLERLWGPEPVLVARIGAALAPLLPGRPRAGIAGTRFTAAVAARVGPRRDPAASGETDGRAGAVPSGRADPPARSVPSHAVAGGGPGDLVARTVEPGGDAVFLAPLPAALLSLDPEVRARLGRLGLATVGAVASVPRSALVARFGSDEGSRLHARATGEETDRFEPRRAPGRLSLALPIDPPTDEIEPLRFVLRRLAATLGDQVAARGEGAGRVVLRLSLDRSFAAGAAARAPDVVVEQRFPEPTSDAEAVERLLLARLETAPPVAPVSRVDLELAEVVAAAGRQLSLFSPEADRSARVAWELARLAIRAGEGIVGRVALADPDAPLPEGRWRWLPADPAGGAPRSSPTGGAPGRRRGTGR